MNNPGLMIVLLIGLFLMCGTLVVQMKWYGIAPWKSAPVSVTLVLLGLFGSRIWFYLENGSFRGRSFYGVVFLAPIVFFLVAKLVRIPYGFAMDLVAPSGCLTLALVKIQCLRDGCCGGKALYIDENRNYVMFPSQIVEMIAFLVVSGVLLLLASKHKYRNKIFPCFLILYGGSRFILNFFRDEIKPYAFGLSAGSFWSLIAFLIGVICLSILYVRNKSDIVA